MGKKVFIGVGHGGKDPGAIGNRLREADINLSIALHLRDELTRNGVSVAMSRTMDEDDPLGEEVRECNAFAPDLAVDIHTNAGGGVGFEAIHSIHGGIGQMLARNIERKVLMMGQKSRGLKTRKNAVGKDYFGFIRETNCPAVILECAFIDSDDSMKIDTDAERKRFAVAYARGILQTLGLSYRGEDKKPMGTVNSVEQAKEILRDKVKLDESTIQFLSYYKYGDSLLLKLAQAVQLRK